MERRAELLNLMNTARQRGAVAVEILRVHRELLEQPDARSVAIHREEQRWQIRTWRADHLHGTGEGASREEALDRSFADSQPTDPHSGPAERMAIRSSGLGIDDRRHLSIGDADRVEVLQAAERTGHSALFRPRRLLYRQERCTRSFVNSRGVEAEEAATAYRLYAETLVEGSLLTQQIASRHFSDVASLPFGTELKRRMDPLFRRISSVPDLPIVLEPRATAELFRSLAPAFAADAVLSKRSFLHAFLNKAIASPIFHLTDDAGMFGGLLTHSFDDRGVPPIPVTLLKEGVVTGLYHTPETARQNGLRATGHSVADALHPSNLVVRPGARTRNVTLGELGTYLLLDAPPPLDTQTGRVEGSMDLVLVERGERRGSLRRPISTTIQAILGSVVEVVSDHERSCEIDAPTAIFAPRFGLAA